MKTSMEANPMLNKTKLKAELALICTTEWFRRCSGAVALYQVFMGNNLQDTFSETVALLKIPILTPMTTAESVRCFSSVKRIKTFLRKTMLQDCLCPLAMLSMVKNFVKTIPDINHQSMRSFHRENAQTTRRRALA
ncbi:hypothetical protein CRENBAI_022248 [Crenichthys baileyi]|uniref:HAT C-terminal dimerisation domain-containing protein n=1 Tax=Crenichthys baileyi TaxID=28760 RepID=A0AAV9QPE0_9TELE